MNLLSLGRHLTWINGVRQRMGFNIAFGKARSAIAGADAESGLLANGCHANGGHAMATARHEIARQLMELAARYRFQG